MPENLAGWCSDPKATGQQAAERFAESMRRQVEWIDQTAGTFRMVDGVKIYKLQAVRGGWNILLVEGATDAA